MHYRIKSESTTMHRIETSLSIVTFPKLIVEKLDLAGGQGLGTTVILHLIKFLVSSYCIH